MAQSPSPTGFVEHVNITVRNPAKLATLCCRIQGLSTGKRSKHTLANRARRLRRHLLPNDDADQSIPWIIPIPMRDLDRPK